MNPVIIFVHKMPQSLKEKYNKQWLANWSRLPGFVVSKYVNINSFIHLVIHSYFFSIGTSVNILGPLLFNVMVQQLFSHFATGRAPWRERQTIIPGKHPSVVEKTWKRSSNGVKAWFSPATQAKAQAYAQAQERVFHRENELDACASTSASVQIFPFPYAYACFCLLLLALLFGFTWHYCLMLEIMLDGQKDDAIVLLIHLVEVPVSFWKYHVRYRKLILLSGFFFSL